MSESAQAAAAPAAPALDPTPDKERALMLRAPPCHAARSRSIQQCPGELSTHE